MKAKLLKTEVNYLLEDEKGVVIASTSIKKEGLALSLNNCLEIENRYDLSALFCEVDESIDYHEFDLTSFRLGFQKALEFLGDKKFSEEDIEEAFAFGQLNQLHDLKYFSGSKAYIQSLQQTEWEVEIVMVEKWIAGTSVYGHGEYESIPKLDSDGCLILKRK